MLELKTKPFQYQIDDVQSISKFRGRALVANEPGTGKTLESLMWIAQNNAFPAIIVCPASLKWNWEQEAKKHYGIHCEILSGRKPIKLASSIRNQVIWIINYDILRGWMDFLLSMDPKVIVFDEIHYVKSRTSIRSKASKYLASKIPHVLGLSGTPLTNRPAELFSVLNIIRPDLYNKFYPFATRYCNLKKTPWGWDYSGARNLGELHRDLSHTMMIRRKKEDVLKDLPSKMRHVIPLPIEDEKEYNEAVHNFVNWLKGEKYQSIQEGNKSEKMVQLGYLKRLAAQLKMKYIYEWLDNFLDESDEKIVVSTCHRFMINGLYDRYKKLSVKVDGSVLNKDRRTAFQTFTDSSSCRIFFGNIQAAGTGWNATVASNLAFVELPWTPGEVTQMEDRINRIGSVNHSMYHYLIARGTIEEDLCKIIQRKQKILDITLDGGVVKDSIDIFDQLSELLTSKEGFDLTPKKVKR